MALEQYGFFQSTVDDTRSYDSSDIANAFWALASSGVADLGTNLQVTAEGGSMNVVVDYGKGMIKGRYYYLKNNGGGNKIFAIATEPALNRTDRIVMRLDLTARTITLQKLVGTAGSSPTAPGLTRTGTVWDMSLAAVHITAGATELVAEDITDERDDDTVCGLIAPESLRMSTVLALIGSALTDAQLLSFAEMTLTDPQKLQSRANIAAQEGITATGMLKGTGIAVQTAGAHIDYAVPTIEYAATLTVAAWSGATAPFTQSIAVSGMTASKKGVSAGLPASATDAQYEAALEALLRVSAQGSNALTIKAHGVKPIIDIPVLVRVASVDPT